MQFSPLNWTGRILRRAGNEILKVNSVKGTWIDVGAHHGETTFGYASRNPGLTIYAFEPNWDLARSMMGKLANFIVMPMAVSEADGVAEFFLNAHDSASSLLSLDPKGVSNWKGGETLRVQGKTIVPTIRLDTFMSSAAIQNVDYLKIDAQGADLAVVRSAGQRLRDIRKITLEVDVTSNRLYHGSPSKEEVLSFLQAAGFKLIAHEQQSYGQEENLTFECSPSQC